MALISSRHDKDDWIVTLEAKHDLLSSLLKNRSTAKGPETVEGKTLPRRCTGNTHGKPDHCQFL